MTRKLKSGLTPADIAWIQGIGEQRRALPTPKQIAFAKRVSVAEVYRYLRRKTPSG